MSLNFSRFLDGSFLCTHDYGWLRLGYVRSDIGSLPGVVWSREEALASVIAAEAVDLPVDGANINYHDKLPPLTGTCVWVWVHLRVNGG